MAPSTVVVVVVAIGVVVLVKGDSVCKTIPSTFSFPVKRTCLLLLTLLLLLVGLTLSLLMVVLFGTVSSAAFSDGCSVGVTCAAAFVVGGAFQAVDGHDTMEDASGMRIVGSTPAWLLLSSSLEDGIILVAAVVLVVVVAFDLLMAMGVRIFNVDTEAAGVEVVVAAVDGDTAGIETVSGVDCCCC